MELLKHHKTTQAQEFMQLRIPRDERGCVFTNEAGEHLDNSTVRVRRRISRFSRRTRVVGTFPDGNSALMLVCARLRHVAGTQWGCKKYMNMKHLEAALDDASIAG